MQPAEVSDCSCYWQRADCKGALPAPICSSPAAGHVDSRVNLTIVLFDCRLGCNAAAGLLTAVPVIRPCGSVRHQQESSCLHPAQTLALQSSSFSRLEETHSARCRPRLAACRPPCGRAHLILCIGPSQQHIVEPRRVGGSQSREQAPAPPAGRPLGQQRSRLLQRSSAHRANHSRCNRLNPGRGGWSHRKPRGVQRQQRRQRQRQPQQRSNRWLPSFLPPAPYTLLQLRRW